jgi:small subunit ribosomal protein S4
VGEKLFLKGERCFTPRCAIERRRSAPGDQSGRRRRLSDHGIQLREKQKARYSYGVMESQFRRYMEQAFKGSGVTGQYLLQLLERRLDNVVYRLGFAESRRQSRQLVLHGHFTVNGRKVNIPSYTVQVGDVIAWKESNKQKDFFKELTDEIPKRPVPQWLALDVGAMTGRAASLPTDEDLETLIDTRLIVEFYSR